MPATADKPHRCPKTPRGSRAMSDPAATVSHVLHELRISDLGVIDDAVLEPHAGFTVVTGETGAGKTMIVTALGLVTGGRGDAARVRAGSDRAVVEARLAIDPAGTPAAITAAAGGRLDEDGTVIAVRSVGADGRSRAHLGGRSVPLATLSELTDSLIAVHGQSEAISLLRPAQQRSVLDQFAGLDDELREYRALRTQWQQLAADLADRRARARERAQREQLLRLGLSEITAMSPLPGEDVELIAEARRLENVDGLRSAAQLAVTSLSGSEELADAPTAVGLVQAARHDLESSADPRLAELAGQLQQASVTLVDVASELAGYLSGLDADPARLQEVLARQAALRTLTRRYGEDVDAVLAWARRCHRGTGEPRFLRASAGRTADQARCAPDRGRRGGGQDVPSPVRRGRAAWPVGDQGTRSAGDGQGRRPGAGGAARSRRRRTPTPCRSTVAG